MANKVNGEIFAYFNKNVLKKDLCEKIKNGFLKAFSHLTNALRPTVELEGFSMTKS